MVAAQGRAVSCAPLQCLSAEDLAGVDRMTATWGKFILESTITLARSQTKNANRVQRTAKRELTDLKVLYRSDSNFHSFRVYLLLVQCADLKPTNSSRVQEQS